MNIIDFILKKDYRGLKNKLDKKDENINQLSPSGNSFLITAIAERFEDGAILLVENDINVSILNKYQDSALSVAAAHNAYDVAKLIIEKDKSLVNVLDSYGNNPLWTAIVCALKKIDIDYRMIDLLIENESDLFHENKKGQTCLYLIERRERFEIIDHIKEKFPDKLRL
jgi:ankyrin repeat protein